MYRPIFIRRKEDQKGRSERKQCCLERDHDSEEPTKIITKSIPKNRGAAVVEAAIGVPIFLFLLLFLFYAIQVSSVRQVVYEAGIEAAEYAAEYYYLVEETALTSGDSEGLIDSGALLLLAEHRLSEAVDDPELIQKCVSGGMSGIHLLGSELPGEDGDLILHIRYEICINTPLLPTVTREVEETIRQKPYTGRKNSGGSETDPDPYVYVTDNREVYHLSRGCTYLTLKINALTKKAAEKKGYRPCSFCGKTAGDFVLIGEEGKCYHGSRDCSGLKRTVHRVRLSEVSGLPKCSRCGK